ncbi:hypothetical protein RTE01_30610 [Raoultella terrigena]|nr:hypothetical protein RTE01_30610 [Raoultella terrigena]
MIIIIAMTYTVLLRMLSALVCLNSTKSYLLFAQSYQNAPNNKREKSYNKLMAVTV